MQTMEPSTTFGQLDKTFLGLWLNADPIVRSPHAERALPLFWRSLYQPVSEDHRAFVAASTSGSERGLAAAAFTAATHESRHFHDLLFSTYGSVLARQHVRAALLVRTCLNQMLFRSRMMIVPLDAWRDYWQTLHVADDRVEPPAPALADLGDALRIMRTKLDAFNQGVFCPAQLKITATGILEAIAGTVQARTIHREFGQEASTDFLDLMRETGAYDRYYGVLERVSGVLGPMPAEAMLLLLEASLCGNFQDPRQEVPRYPADLLLAMLAWLERNHIRPGRLATFGDLYTKVDDFFDYQFGEDLQGTVIQAAKLNWDQALPTFREMAKAIPGSGTSEADQGAAAAVDAFESFTRTGAALGGNVCQDPSWFCGEHYYRVWNHLPRPLVLVGTNYGIPITPDLDRVFDVHQSVGVVSHDKAAGRTTDPPPQLLDRLPGGTGRFALLVSMRPALVRGLSKDVELPIAAQFVMPPVDLQAWVQHYEGTTVLLRFLMEGEESALTALDQRLILSLFSLVGTDIYGLADRLDMPSAADALAAAVRDPYLNRKYADPEFLKLLATLRSQKGRAPETVEVRPPRARPTGDLGSRDGAG